MNRLFRTRFVGLSIAAAVVLAASLYSRPRPAAAADSNDLTVCPAAAKDALVSSLAARVRAEGQAGHLATFLYLRASARRRVGKVCAWPAGELTSSTTEAVDLLSEFHRWSEADELLSAGLAELPNASRADTERLEFLALQAAIGIKRRDAPSFSAALSNYERVRGTRQDPADIKSLAEELRNCSHNGLARLSCRDDQNAILFGQYTLSASGEISGECPARAVLDETLLQPGQPLAIVAEPFRAHARACKLDAEIANLARDWTIARNEGNSAAHDLAKALVVRLIALGSEIDRFDADNPVSRFEVAALAFYVQRTDNDSQRRDSILESADEQARDRVARDGIEAAYTEALPLIISGRSGFLQTDDIGLAAFVAANAYWSRRTADQAVDDVWRLVLASRGEPGFARVSLAELRSRMKTGQVLVATVHAMEGPGLLAVIPAVGWPTLHELPVSARDVTTYGKLLFDSVTQKPEPGSYFPLIAARSLYKIYVCPALAVSDSPKEILYLADPFLERVPLTALARPIGGCTGRMGDDDGHSLAPIENLRAVRWVGDDYAIRMLTLGERARWTEQSERHGYLGVGAVERKPRPPPNGSSAAGVDNQRLIAWSQPTLKFADDELNISAGDRSDSTILEGPRASEPQVRKALSRNSAIIHFATHALDPETPGIREPLLVLTPPERVLRDDDDGILTAREVRSLSVNTSVVVLSACRTAAPAAGQGNGLFSGLVQGFFSAGAQSAVATYWPVDDPASAQIVPQIIEHLRESDEPALAVRAAQSAWRDDARKRESIETHPYYWASFIAISPLQSALRTPSSR